ncbi:MAG: hypothetical protein KGM47_06660, partial [Acidobacteriota bacterium]|nr:hypothetical protein [Acidobacteriota bacterium]
MMEFLWLFDEQPAGRVPNFILNIFIPDIFHRRFPIDSRQQERAEVPQSSRLKIQFPLLAGVQG